MPRETAEQQQAVLAVLSRQFSLCDGAMNSLIRELSSLIRELMCVSVMFFFSSQLGPALTLFMRSYVCSTVYVCTHVYVRTAIRNHI